MMNHEECVAYFKSNSNSYNELELDPQNDYGNLTLHYETKFNQYYWSIENFDGEYYSHDWTPIPEYLGDALINYYASNN